MAHKLNLCSALGLSVGLAACGGSNQPSASAPPTAPTPQAIDTAQVLALAQATSETDAPFTVDGRELTFTDTSEASPPVTVNAP